MDDKPVISAINQGRDLSINMDGRLLESFAGVKKGAKIWSGYQFNKP